MRKYARVFQYLRPYSGQILLYTVFIVLSTVFSVLSIGMLMPFFELIFTGSSRVQQLAEAESRIDALLNGAMNAVRDAADGNYMVMLLIICGVMIVSIVLKNLFLYLAYYILNPLKTMVTTKMREDIYSKVLLLPIGYFTERRKGDLMSRVTNDISELELSVVGTLEGWIRDPLQIVIYLGVLLYMSWQLTLFILLLLPIMGFIIGRISRSLKRQGQRAATLQGETVSILDETLGGLRVIKAFNAEGILRNRFNAVNQQLLATRNAMGYRRDLASPLSETLGVVVFCAVLLYGGKLVLLDQTLGGKILIGFLGMFYNIINPAKALSTSFYNMQKGSAAIGRIEEVLQAPLVVEDVAGALVLPEFKESIEFRNVGFSYDQKVVLQNINLIIKRGSTVALVGSSGAGKSTLADLIPRFHDVSTGELLIDGKNVKDYQLASLRSHMGIVTQDPVLFNDTLQANIALGEENADSQRVQRAAIVANAHEFIVRRDGGYESLAGDRGSRLSGGERQRVTIARAVYKNPPILILDEATSSLDTESEKLVQDAINRVMENRTTVVIAHRLSTVRHADEIVVLQAGTIVERGTHDSLMQANGFYKRLVDMQEVK